MEQKATNPEKKLLEIIEASQQQAAPAPTPAKESVVKTEAVKTIPRAKSFSPKDFITGLTGLINNIKALFSSGAAFAFQLKRINIVLLFVSFALFIYTFVYFLTYKNNTNKNIAHIQEGLGSIPAKDPSMVKIALPGISNEYLSAVVEKIRRRDLFKPVTAETLKAAASGDVAAKEAELIKNLKLVGISIAVNPQDSYALIEDLATKNTYFLKKDETIKGLTVASILNDKVIFSYQDKQVELR